MYVIEFEMTPTIRRRRGPRRGGVPLTLSSSSVTVHWKHVHETAHRLPIWQIRDGEMIKLRRNSMRRVKNGKRLAFLYTGGQRPSASFFLKTLVNLVHENGHL